MPTNLRQLGAVVQLVTIPLLVVTLTTLPGVTLHTLLKVTLPTLDKEHFSLRPSTQQL